jgi:hypothetical protein
LPASPRIHATVYLDQCLKDRYVEPVSGKSFDPAWTLPWHELAELFFTQEHDLHYLDAHHIANRI